MRDDDLRSDHFLEVEKYPTITFKSTRLELMSSEHGLVIGDLTIHGVTKEAVLDIDGPTPVMKDPRGNEHMGASATTKINRQDFGVSWQDTMDRGGIVVGNEIDITIDAEAILEDI